MSLFHTTAIAGLLVGGMGVALLGSVKVALARTLQIDEARVGGLVSIFGFAVIPVMLTVGFLTDLVDKQWVLAGSFVLLIGSLILLARSRSYWSALIAVLVVSAAWSTLINVLNVLVPFAFTGNLSYAMNMANVYYGLGALLTPLVVAFLLRRLGFTPTVMTVAALVFVSLLLTIIAAFPAEVAGAGHEAEAATKGLRGMIALGTYPVVWLCALAVCFYTPLEAATAAWTTTYLGDQGLSEQAASGVLSAFWLSYMTARLATAFCLSPGAEMPLIVGLSLACILVLIGMVIRGNRRLAVILVIAAGLAFGPIFPTLMAIVLGSTAPSLHGRVVGLVFAVGGIGWSVIPMLQGAYARRTSVQRGFLVAVASAVGLFVMVLLLAIYGVAV